MECSMCMKHKMVSKARWNDSKDVKQRKDNSKVWKWEENVCKLTLLTKQETNKWILQKGQETNN